MNDQQLIQYLSTSNPARRQKAWRYVIDTFAPMCRQRTASSQVPEADQQDIFQDCMILLYEKVQDRNFSLTSELSAYFYGLWKKKLYEYFRRQKKNQKHTSTDDLPHELIADTKSPDESESEEAKLPTGTKIRQAIEALGPPCRELLSGYYFRRTPLKELGVALGYKNENTVKQMKFKCMRRLKKSFKPQAHDQRRQQNRDY